MGKFFSVFVFFIFFSLMPLSCQETYEADADTSFYSLSSLQFHTEEMLKSEFSQEDSIHFSDDEVATLWESARNSPFVGELISSSQDYYYRALEHIEEPSLFKELMSQANALLEKAWKKSNKKFFEKTIPLKDLLYKANINFELE